MAAPPSSSKTAVRKANASVQEEVPDTASIDDQTAEADDMKEFVASQDYQLHQTATK